MSCTSMPDPRPGPFAPDPDHGSAAESVVGASPGVALPKVDAPVATPSELPYLVVRLGTERFALPLEIVLEALDEPQLRPLPGVAEPWLGLVIWRGARIPLASARLALGRSAESGSESVVVMRGTSMPFALVVDEFVDVRPLSSSRQRPFQGRHDSHGVLKAVVWDGEALVGIVNPVALLASLTEGDTRSIGGRPASLRGAEDPDGVASPSTAATVLPGIQRKAG